LTLEKKHTLAGKKTAISKKRSKQGAEDRSGFAPPIIEINAGFQEAKLHYYKCVTF
jgi:hypothetical protein